MSETKQFPKGINYFKPHEKAPSFVLGSIIVNANEFYKWMQDNKHLLVEHEKYGKQFKFQLTDKGLSVDTWKPTQQAQPKQETKASTTGWQANDSQDVPF